LNPPKASNFLAKREQVPGRRPKKLTPRTFAPTTFSCGKNDVGVFATSKMSLRLRYGRVDKD
jgi:hypothetical protein